MMIYKKTLFSNLLFVFKDNSFSDWSPWTDCLGVSCKMGRQQRIRACLNPPVIDGKKSICNGEQIQERDCLAPCSNKNSSSFSPVRSLSNGNYKTENKNFVTFFFAY
jgi:hypothetical protein